jgi:molybdopterin-guanine dinucleotide biosynthesis protein A
MRCGGVILGGGKSTRMGMSKAMLPFGDELLLARVLRLLGEVVSPIVVVAAPNQELPPLAGEVIFARDEQEGRGPLEGLRAGLRAMQGHADVVYATSCDVPLLAPGFVRRMIELLDRNAQCEILIPRDGQFHHPLAAVYRTSMLPLVEELLAMGRLRPTFLMEKCRTLEVPVDELRGVDPALATLVNCNCPEDYFAALATVGLTPDADIVRAFAGQ